MKCEKLGPNLDLGILLANLKLDTKHSARSYSAVIAWIQLYVSVLELAYSFGPLRQ